MLLYNCANCDSTVDTVLNLITEVTPLNILIDYHSRTPIYEQIKEEIILAVSRGELKKDEQLPSLRVLSTQLSVNINTIKRALSELEDQGIIYTVAGKGIFINGNAQTKAYLDSALEELRAGLVNAKALGAKKEDIASIINEIFTERKDD